MNRAMAIAALLLPAACGASSRPAQPVGNTGSGGGDCPKAYLAVSDERVEIYEVTPDCRVTLRNTIDGVSGVPVWASAGAALVLYDVTEPDEDAPGAVLRQQIIEHPLTSGPVTPSWKTITFGEPDLEGQLDWGFVGDGRHAYAIGCAEWEEQNEEEWSCAAFEFLREDGTRTTAPPLPAFARPFVAGPIFDSVELVPLAKRGQEPTLVCQSRAGGEDELTAESAFLGEPVGIAPRAGDRYFLFRASPGTRASAASSYAVTAMKGCQLDREAPGVFDPGPDGLFAQRAIIDDRDLGPARVYVGDVAEPLRAADGTPFETTGALAWAAP